MGHELTHSLTNRLFRDGRTLTLPARTALLGRAACIQASFSLPSPLLMSQDKLEEGAERQCGEGEDCDAAATLGEDLADLGGVRWAFQAFLYWAKPSPFPIPPSPLPGP